MTTAELQDYLPGMNVEVLCRTSCADIYFNEIQSDGTGRMPFMPSARYAQLSELYYKQTGSVVGVDYDRLTPCLVLHYKGEGVLLDDIEVNGKIVTRIIGYEVRLKAMRIPVKAIQKVKILYKS